MAHVSRMALLMAVVGCAHPVSDALRDARSSSELDDFELVYEERGGASLGHDRIVVGPTSIERTRHRPTFAAGADQPEEGLEPNQSQDAPPITEQATLPPEQRAELVSLLIEIEAWKEADDDGLPSEPVERAKATLRIRIGSARSEISEWVNDLATNNRLIRVKLALERALGNSQPPRD